MQQAGLYFPFVHVRDDSWLKAAILYWPSVRRLVPVGYAKHDSLIAQTFFDAGLLRDEDPGSMIHDMQWNLARALSENAGLLVRDYSLERAFAAADNGNWAERNGPGWETPALGWIHRTKFPDDVLESLSDMGLARYGRAVDPVRGHSGGPHEWIGLHPALAGAYMTALAGRLSERAHFEPLTDQVDLRLATPSYDVQTALKLLLGRSTDQAVDAGLDAGVDTYVMLALQHVHPTNLDGVPADKIVQCRETLVDELTTFRSYVAKQHAELADLATIPLKGRRLEAFAEHVEQTIELPLRKLENGLRLLKLQPVRSLLLAGSLAPPAALNAVLGATGSLKPAAAIVGGSMAAVGGAWWSVSKLRTDARANSPVGYLLDVRDQLTPKTLASRARKVLRGTYGSR
jgi:hypothetical protein